MRIVSAKSRANDVERLSSALAVAADLFLADPIYLPIFLSLEAEIALDAAQGDVIARARLLARQSASA